MGGINPKNLVVALVALLVLVGVYVASPSAKAFESPLSPLSPLAVEGRVEVQAAPTSVVYEVILPLVFGGGE